MGIKDYGSEEGVSVDRENARSPRSSGGMKQGGRRISTIPPPPVERRGVCYRVGAGAGDKVDVGVPHQGSSQAGEAGACQGNRRPQSSPNCRDKAAAEAP